MTKQLFVSLNCGRLQIITIMFTIVNYDKPYKLEFVTFSYKGLNHWRFIRLKMTKMKQIAHCRLVNEDKVSFK